MWASKQENSLFLYLRSRAEMHTQRERVSIGRLSNERACSESEAGQRPRRRPGWGGRSDVMQVTHARQSPTPPPRPHLCLPLANYLVSFSHLTGPWTSPRCMYNFSSKMDPITEGYGCLATLIMGLGPLPIQPPRRPPAHRQTGKTSLTSGVGTLSLSFSRAQLLPLALSLGVSGREQRLSFTPWDKYQASSPEAHCLPPHHETVSFPVSGLWHHYSLNSIKTILPSNSGL